jgi:hypothetical protein
MILLLYSITSIKLEVKLYDVFVEFIYRFLSHYLEHQWGEYWVGGDMQLAGDAVHNDL